MHAWIDSKQHAYYTLQVEAPQVPSAGVTHHVIFNAHDTFSTDRIVSCAVMQHGTHANVGRWIHALKREVPALARVNIVVDVGGRQ